jgi:hypothetical protein
VRRNRTADASRLSAVGWLVISVQVSSDARRAVGFSVGGQYLLNKAHYEFNPIGDYVVLGNVERSMCGRLTWRF